jgi:hypothetical protein
VSLEAGDEVWLVEALELTVLVAVVPVKVGVLVAVDVSELVPVLVCVVVKQPSLTKNCL